MAKVKVELNNSGVRELFRSNEVAGWLEEVGKVVADNARGMSGEDYEVGIHKSATTAIANVRVASGEAAGDNLKNNTLAKALGNSGLFNKKPHL